MRQRHIPNAQAVENTKHAATVTKLVQTLSAHEARAFSALEDAHYVVCFVSHLHPVGVHFHDALQQIDLLECVTHARVVDCVREIIFPLRAVLLELLDTFLASILYGGCVA